jgi:uncharacterized damage-inducible protein DinB
MTQKEILLAEIGSCHDVNHWFVAMNGALKGLGAAQAAADCGNGAHSIRQILYHVTYWNDRWLQRFIGGKQTPGPKDNDESFGPPEADAGSWKTLVERFDAVMKAWTKVIGEAEDSALAAPIQKDSKSEWHELIGDMILHTAYHLGQIVTLRKLQGSWDPAQGVT